MISLEFLSKSPTPSMMLMTFIGHMNCYSERSSRSMPQQKKKTPKPNPPPNMNSHYRKIIYKTRQARDSYNKNQTPDNWKKITKLRNMKTKIKRESISVYFLERCGGGPKSKNFWPTIKPFLSQKSTIKDECGSTRPRVKSA